MALWADRFRFRSNQELATATRTDGDKREGFAFARHAVLTGKPWGLGEPVELAGPNVRVLFSLSPEAIKDGRPSAILHSTTSTGHTGQAVWRETEAQVATVGGQPGVFDVSARLPSSDVTHWFVNLKADMIDQASGKSLPALISSRVVSP